MHTVYRYLIWQSIIVNNNTYYYFILSWNNLIIAYGEIKTIHGEKKTVTIATEQ